MIYLNLHVFGYSTLVYRVKKKALRTHSTTGCKANIDKSTRMMTNTLLQVRTEMSTLQ